MSSIVERAITFTSAGASLLAILHSAERADATVGIVVVVGGPQYRVGSHRQFVLMARALARHGTPVLRFDYRGMGDSDGPQVGFEGCGDDIRSAIDLLQRERPSVKDVYLFGLCDAASAAMMYASSDARVRGLIIANPWARTEGTQAATFLKHYYIKRVLQPSFWMKLLKGGLQVRDSMTDLAQNVRRAGGASEPAQGAGSSFIARMLEGMRAFRGRTLLIMSGDDLTAREFGDLIAADREWRKVCRKASLTRVDLAEADHTFSSRASLDAAVQACATWLRASA